MKYYKHIVTSFLAVTILGTPWLITRFPESRTFIDNIFSYVGNNYTAVFFQEGLTIAELKQKYENSDRKRNDKIRIMLVPGHEPSYGGAEYGDLKERDMNVDLANELRAFFENNPHYEVIVARDKNTWNEALQDYFAQNWQSIIDFLNESKQEMKELVEDGSVVRYQNGIYHNDAPKDVALRLYGINKWNNENDIDLAIHIHFNDYPRSNRSQPGKYSGVAIYVPEKQYSNSTSTYAIADAVFRRLSKYNPTSDLPIENDGVIQTQELIAVGSHNTLDIPSMLIEYAYIYEPQFEKADVRALAIKDLAFQTYLGVEDFFDNKKSSSLAYDTLLLPYYWNGSFNRENAGEGEVLALQTVLIEEGLYPPASRNKNDCPRTGTFGPCTISALSAFQDKYGITGETGYVGEKTKEVLNSMYSVKLR